MMMKNLLRLGLAIALLGAVGAAQAGHLFNQGAPTNLNAPVTLSAGSSLGVQPSQPPFTLSATNLNLYGASFDAGDVVQVQWGTGASDSINMGVGITGCVGGGSGLFCGGALGSTPSVLSSFNAALVSGGPIALNVLSGTVTIGGLIFDSGVRWLGSRINQVNVTFASVSEPTTLAVLGLGLVGVAVSGLRRRRREAPTA